MRIDRRSPQPLYAQLKELLVERIQRQDYQPGQRIPSELDLCQELSLSRPTVRQAIAELVSEGILVIVKGKGTYVADEPERIDIKNVNANQFSLLAARNLDPFMALAIERLDGDGELNRLFSVADTTAKTDYWSVSWQQQEEGQIYV